MRSRLARLTAVSRLGHYEGPSLSSAHNYSISPVPSCHLPSHRLLLLRHDTQPYSRVARGFVVAKCNGTTTRDLGLLSLSASNSLFVVSKSILP